MHQSQILNCFSPSSTKHRFFKIILFLSEVNLLIYDFLREIYLNFLDFIHFSYLKMLLLFQIFILNYLNFSFHE